MVINRRKFLRWLGVGSAAAAVAPKALSACEDPWCGSIGGEGIIPHDELHEAIVEHASPVTETYGEYVNFSQFALQSSIDEIVSKAAEQLGKEAAESVNASWQA